jgi:N-acetylglucosaminyl-diphospho-decaprenol L-rhamnosyltransferase
MDEPVAPVAVIVVSWNTRELLADCLASIADTGGGATIEMIVVDNDSTDGSQAMVRERFPSVRLIANDRNRGFGAANNQAIATTDAPYVLMLNSDASLPPGALARLLERLEAEPRAGLVGAQLRYPDGTFQFSHARFPDLWQELLVLSGLGRWCYGPHYPSCGPDAAHGARVVDWVGGACMLARRAALAAVGGFDEGYFMYGEEMDLCYALRAAGWQVWYEPAAWVEHHSGGSSRQSAETVEAQLYRGRLRFFRKHYGATATRLLAAQLSLLTPPKIAVHALLRTLSGGRVGRRVISLRTLRAALAADAPLTRRGPAPPVEEK